MQGSNPRGQCLSHLQASKVWHRLTPEEKLIYLSLEWQYYLSCVPLKRLEELYYVTGITERKLQNRLDSMVSKGALIINQDGEYSTAIYT